MSGLPNVMFGLGSKLVDMRTVAYWLPLFSIHLAINCIRSVVVLRLVVPSGLLPRELNTYAVR